jgi:DNA-binding NarL/FixJ family response regulator
VTRGVARVLVADDHPIVRRGLAQIIDAEPDLAVVAEAADGEEALARAIDDEVDIAILDIKMPRLGGLDVARELHRRHPSVRTVILSMYGNEEFVAEAARVGASGYVLKSQADQDIVETCRGALRGDGLVGPDLGDDRALLTPREVEVVRLIAQGKVTKEIAQDLVITIKTVETHRANILRKLGARDRVELTKYAIRRGLIDA